MNYENSGTRLLPALFGCVALGSWLATACIADEPGIDAHETAGTASGGDAAQGGNGAASGATAGTAPQTAGGGNGSAGTDTASQGGKTSGGGSSAGTPAAVDGGAGGAAGEGNVGGVPADAEACVFHSTAPDVPDGEGGAGPAPTITMQTSPFVGTYLADGAGRTLYVYGVDLPGDCRADNAPKSRCEADCLTSWPLFDAGDRVLGAGLSDDGFGSIQRADGLWQTTYFGWPLYYYKTDLTLGQMTGQGKGKTWHVAETTPASIVIMKEGAVKYLADGAGRTLYVSASDTVGSAPVSQCNAECLQAFERFHQSNPSLVPSLEQQDFSVFLASGAELQLAFKGQPLYRARTDVKAGDTTGTATSGFTVAILP
jgi:predicted lipoprotein with Yx(FWY)xxD motif